MFISRKRARSDTGRFCSGSGGRNLAKRSKSTPRVSRFPSSLRGFVVDGSSSGRSSTSTSVSSSSTSTGGSSSISASLGSSSASLGTSSASLGTSSSSSSGLSSVVGVGRKPRKGENDVPPHVKFLKKDGYRRLYKCTLCNKVTTTKRNAKNHVICLTGLRLTCKVEGCRSSFTNKYNLIHHERTIHAGNEVGVGVTTRAKWATQGPSGQRTFPCPRPGCEKIFKKFTTLANHLRNWNHSERGHYRCRQCNLKYKIKTNLEKHRLQKHPKLVPLPCELCDFVSPGKVELVEHIQQVHGKRRKVAETISDLTQTPSQKSLKKKVIDKAAAKGRLERSEMFQARPNRINQKRKRVCAPATPTATANASVSSSSARVGNGTGVNVSVDNAETDDTDSSDSGVSYNTACDDEGMRLGSGTNGQQTEPAAATAQAAVASAASEEHEEATPPSPPAPPPSPPEQRRRSLDSCIIV